MVLSKYFGDVKAMEATGAVSSIGTQLCGLGAAAESLMYYSTDPEASADATIAFIAYFALGTVSFWKSALNEIASSLMDGIDVKRRYAWPTSPEFISGGVAKALGSVLTFLYRKPSRSLSFMMLPAVLGVDALGSIVSGGVQRDVSLEENKYLPSGAHDKSDEIGKLGKLENGLYTTL